MNNIYLIGMPGCGKSAIGKILSRKLGMTHIDADTYLEEKFGMRIPHIFETLGEGAFRKMETQALLDLSKKENIIVSTGGGAVTTPKNKEILKNSGTVVFVDSSPDTILSNSNLGGRPLLKDKTRIHDLYNSRITLYKDFADITADNNGFMEDAVNTIINKIQSYK